MYRKLNLSVSVVIATICALLLGTAFTNIAFAGGYEHDSRDRGDRTIINTDNYAEVNNYLTVKANTGKNVNDGGIGGDGGDGGSATSHDAENGPMAIQSFGGGGNWGDHDDDDDDVGGVFGSGNTNNTGGDGGTGGAGGTGGDTTTGDATAIGTIENDINSTNITVEQCGCEDDEDILDDILDEIFHRKDAGDVQKIDTLNTTILENGLDVKANTGRNNNNGRRGGAGGTGGNAHSDNDGGIGDLLDQEPNTNTGGTGGNGAAGGNGGTQNTGVSSSDGWIKNVINRTVIRMTRASSSDEAAS